MRMHTYESMLTHDGFNLVFEYKGHNLTVRNFMLTRAIATPGGTPTFEFLSTDAKSLQYECLLTVASVMHEDTELLLSKANPLLLEQLQMMQAERDAALEVEPEVDAAHVDRVGHRVVDQLAQQHAVLERLEDL